MKTPRPSLDVCPSCGGFIATWYLDCPCGEDTDFTCAGCNLTPAHNGWAHPEHQPLDLFTSAGADTHE